MSGRRRPQNVDGVLVGFCDGCAGDGLRDGETLSVDGAQKVSERLGVVCGVWRPDGFDISVGDKFCHPSDMVGIGMSGNEIVNLRASIGLELSLYCFR